MTESTSFQIDPSEPDMMIDEIADLRNALICVRSLFESYLYAAPEMQVYWRDQIIDTITDSVGRD